MSQALLSNFDRRSCTRRPQHRDPCFAEPSCGRRKSRNTIVLL